MRTLEPAVLAKYAFGLAQAFNGFYHRHPILSEEREDVRLWRLAAVIYVRRQLARTLELRWLPGAGTDVAMTDESPASDVRVAVAWPQPDYLSALEHAARAARAEPEQDRLPRPWKVRRSASPGGADVDPAQVSSRAAPDVFHSMPRATVMKWCSLELRPRATCPCSASVVGCNCQRGGRRHVVRGIAD